MTSKTIELSTVTYRAPNGKEYSLDFAQMKTDPMYLIQYGVDQNLADAHAGAKAYCIKNLMSETATDKKAEYARAETEWLAYSPEYRAESLNNAIDVLVSKRVAAIMAGTVNTRGAVTKDLAYYVGQVCAERIEGWKKLDEATRAQKVAAIIEGGNPARDSLKAEAQKRMGTTATLALDAI